jgi:hypothetical protein
VGSSGEQVVWRDAIRAGDEDTVPLIGGEPDDALGGVSAGGTGGTGGAGPAAGATRAAITPVDHVADRARLTPLLMADRLKLPNTWYRRSQERTAA